jgi:C_GCAxxG_C_C family probable redox protein
VFEMPEQAKTKAREYFGSSYNCAQSTLRALLETKKCYFKQAPYLAAGFGGGIGRQGQTCGAVTGAIMAIGVLAAQKTSDVKEHKKLTYELAARFLKEFREMKGTTICRELIGFDVGDPQAHAEAEKKGVFQDICSHLVEDAVGIVLAMFAS